MRQDWASPGNWRAGSPASPSSAGNPFSKIEHSIGTGPETPVEDAAIDVFNARLQAEGYWVFGGGLGAPDPGRYQMMMAAISAVHTSARDVRDTDWSQVLALYDQLVAVDRSPVVALNRAIAVAELDGPEVALAVIGRLEPQLAGYHAYHATRADLLRRLGRGEQARAAYDQAIELAGNTAETAYLTRQRDQLG